MNAEPLVVDPGSRGRALNILGHFITVLASGEATEGYEIFLIEGPHGSGPRAHHHPWDEALYVTRGTVEISLDKEVLLALPGTLVHLPAGSAHRFRFGKGGGRCCASPHAWVHRECSSRSIVRFRRTSRTGKSLPGSRGAMR